MNTILLYTIVTIVTYCFMEFVAWSAHKYLMHGPLWSWHEDHHLPKYEKKGFWEKNDRFFFVFAVPSMFSYMAGSYFADYRWLLFVGIGISLYGLTYFLIHDVYIHQRFKWFKQLDGWYSRAILKAHGAHHAIISKDAGVSFGLLVFKPKYFKKKTRQQSEA